MSYNIIGIKWVSTRIPPSDLIKVSDGNSGYNNLYLEFNHGLSDFYQIQKPKIEVISKSSDKLSAACLKNEMSNSVNMCCRDMAETIMKFRRTKKHCLETVETEFYLTSEVSSKNNLYMYEMREISQQNNISNLTQLISDVGKVYNHNPEQKNFSVIIVIGMVEDGVDNSGKIVYTDSHASTLLVDHKNGRLFLFDTSENIHQDPTTQRADPKIFGQLANQITCLNTTGEALQDSDSCTFWATCFAKTLCNCNSIDDIIKGQPGQEFLNPDVLEGTIKNLCRIDHTMIPGYDPTTNIFTTDSPTGNLLNTLKAKQNLACLVQNRQPLPMPNINDYNHQQPHNNQNVNFLNF